MSRNSIGYFPKKYETLAKNKIYNFILAINLHFPLLFWSFIWLVCTRFRIICLVKKSKSQSILFHYFPRNCEQSDDDRNGPTCFPLSLRTNLSLCHESLSFLFFIFCFFLFTSLLIYFPFFFIISVSLPVTILSNK